MSYNNTRLQFRNVFNTDQIATGTALGPTDGDIIIKSDGDITLHLDDDSDESSSFIIKNGGNTNVFTIDESGNTVVAGDLTVSGTTTTVNQTEVNVQNAFVFEGATANAHETTLSIVDPTADHTQYLINQGGYVALLAASTTTAITATPEELNLLDGVSGLVQADFTKLAAISASAADINLIDGSAAGTIANSKSVVYGSGGEVNATKLQVGGTDITATPAELNLLDTAVANTVVNSKAVIYGSSGELAGTLSTAAQTNVTSLGTLTALTGGTGDFNWDSNTLVVDSSANKVGILTAAPAAPLHILGNNGQGDLSSVDGPTMLLLQRTTAGNDCQMSVISADNGSAVINFGDKDDENAGGIFYSNSTNSMAFRTNAVDNRLVINSDGTSVFNAPVSLKNGATAGGELKFYEDSDNGTHFTAFKAPAALTGDVTFTLPDGDGSSGQQLTTNGSGVLSWAAAGAAGGDGTLKSIKLNNSAVGDADIVTLDFSSNFTATESPDTEIQIGIAAAQTTITSIHATDLIIGEDAQTAIDFGTADEIDFKAANAVQLTLSDGVFRPQTDSDVDLGTSSLFFKDAFIDKITTTGVIELGHATQTTLSGSSGVLSVEGDAVIVAGAVTGITSLLATDIKIGEDDQTKIDFETADEIHFYAANAQQINLVDGALKPQTDSDVDLGTSSLFFKDAFIDKITTTGVIELGHADQTTLSGSGGTLSVQGTAVVLAGGANHDGFSDFVANEHIDHSAVSITAGTGLTGGGTIAANRTLNVIGGDGITANANDIAVTAAQTTITSLFATDIKIGEDDQTKIDFEDANQINFYANNAKEMILAENALTPGANDGTALGTTAVGWSDLFLADAGTVTFGNDQDIVLSHVADKGLTLSSAASGMPEFILKNTNNDAAGGRLVFDKDGANAADNDILGVVDFVGENDAGSPETIIYAHIEGGSGDVSDSSEDGYIELKAMVAGSATALLDINKTLAGGVAVLTDLQVGDDVSLKSDGAILKMGANEEIAITHVHDTGILVTDSGGTPTIQLHDANESISSDGAKLILTSNGVAFAMPTADGSNGQQLTTDGNGALSWAAAGSGGSTAADDIGTGDAAVNIVTSSGNITLDAQANDADIILKVDDGGTAITALTLDGSAGGTAIFKNDIELASDAAILKFGSDGDVTLTHNADKGLILEAGGVSAMPEFEIRNTNADASGGRLLFNKEVGNNQEADNDVLGVIDFVGNDDGNADTIYAAISGVSTDVTNSTEDGALKFTTMAAGSAVEAFRVESGKVHFPTDGHVLNFGADADVSITHNADKGLTIQQTATGDNKYTVLTLASSEQTITANEKIASIEWKSSDDGGTDANEVCAAIDAVSRDAFAADVNNASLVFRTATSEVATAKMELTNTGSLKMLLDGQEIEFGVNSDISLIHDHDQGLKIKNNKTGDNNEVILTLEAAEENITVNEKLGSIEFKANDSDGSDGALVSGAIDCIATATFDGSNNPTKLVFRTGNSEVAASKMELDNEGDLLLPTDNVMISFGASATPDITLKHVHDTGLTLTNTVSNTNNRPIVLNLKSEENAIIAANELGRIDFTGGDSGGTDAILTAASIAAIATAEHTASVNSTELVFRTGNSEAATDKMSLGPTGDFKLIGGSSHMVLGANPGFSISAHSADANAASLSLTKNRNTGYTGNTVVQDGDELGAIYFKGNDGTDTESMGAAIRCIVAGTPGGNDMPAKLEFGVTADGEDAPATQLSIAGDVVSIGPGDAQGKLSAAGTQALSITSGGNNSTKIELKQGSNEGIGLFTRGNGSVAVQASTLSANTQLQVNMGAGAGGGGVVVNSHGNDNHASQLTFHKTRNTSVGGNTIVQNNDKLGGILWQGNDGSGGENAAGIFGWVGGAPGNDDMPGRLTFEVSPDGSTTLGTVMSIQSDGVRSYAPIRNEGSGSSDFGSDVTLSSGDSGTILRFNTTGNGTFVLPTSSPGLKFTFMFSGIANSKTQHIQCANNTDAFVGFMPMHRSNGSGGVSATAYIGADGNTHDRISFDGGSKGGLQGTLVAIVGLGNNLWQVMTGECFNLHSNDNPASSFNSSN